MNRQTLRDWLLLVFLVTTSLSGCASDTVRHGFKFDARIDSPDIEILDYQYGDSKVHAARANPARVNEGLIPQNAAIYGDIRRPEFLYVKWRVKNTQNTHEDNVDLRSRLPSNIKDHGVYFIVEGAQLYVYLISPERLDPNPCPDRDKLLRLQQSSEPDDRIYAHYCFRKITRIYPDRKGN